MDAPDATLVLNPDELGQDPTAGMDLAVELGISGLEIRTAFGGNSLMLADARLDALRAWLERVLRKGVRQ